MIRKQNESNREIKQNERIQERDNMIEEDINLGRFFELPTTNKIYVNGLNLHQIKSEILLDYTGDFELIESMMIGEIEQKFVRFKNVDDFETYLNAIDNGGYDCEDVIFTGWLYKLNTPDFKKANRSQYGRGTDFKQGIVEYIGNNCYNPTSVNCFIKCINYFTKKDYTEEFSTFIRSEQRRSIVITSARIQPFCGKHIIKIGYFNRKEILPRTFTQRNTALKIPNNHFCFIWKSQNISFNQAIADELKPNFKVVDSVISDKHVKSFIKYEFKPKKVQSQLTNMNVYDLETFKAVPYASCIYRLSKISGKYNRDITRREYEKCKKNVLFLKDWVTLMKC